MSEQENRTDAPQPEVPETEPKTASAEPAAEAQTPETQTSGEQANAGPAPETKHKKKAAGQEAALQAKLDAAEKKAAELKDQLLRTAAEYDNFRKRTLKEKSELLLNGGEKVIASLLPVLDDLERAMDNMEKSTDVATLREGVELIVSKLQKTLATHGLKKIETEGKDFDTDFHEAVAMVPADEEAKKNKIIDCVQAGYMLNEKVIRHSKVVVGQ